MAAIADDIAYNNHDVDDGIRGGLLHLEDLRRVPPVDRFIEEVEAAYPGLPPAKVIYEVNRRLITAMVFDVLGETRRRLAELNPILRRGCASRLAAACGLFGRDGR